VEREETVEPMKTSPWSHKTSSLRQFWSTRLIQSWLAPESAPLPALLGTSLQLAESLYLRGLARDQRLAIRRARRLPAFVISVGNLTVGGTGKTPFTLWLAGHLAGRGLRVAVLSRGYGRRGDEIALAPATGATSVLSRLYGDEPVLMARKLSPIPIWTGRDRYRAGLEAIRHSHAEVIILDDGFQHRALHRDLDLVLMDAHHPFGNGHALPLGPLREPVSHLERASAFLLTRADDPDRTAATRLLLKERFPGKPIFACTHRLTELCSGADPTAIPLGRLEREPAGAFAGIARPESFFDALRSRGISVKRQWAFPDHHVYGPRDVDAIFEGIRHDALRWLITTEKDFVRLPPWLQSVTLAVGLELEFASDLPSLQAAINLALARGPIGSRP
jgi:tetraacyldisaccharide 4'-kinase